MLHTQGGFEVHADLASTLVWPWIRTVTRICRRFLSWGVCARFGVVFVGPEFYAWPVSTKLCGWVGSVSNSPQLRGSPLDSFFGFAKKSKNSKKTKKKSNFRDQVRVISHWWHLIVITFGGARSRTQQRILQPSLGLSPQKGSENKQARQNRQKRKK